MKESSSPNRTFQSLKDILQFYSTILKIPFTSDLPEKSWFHGDLEGFFFLFKKEEFIYLLKIYLLSC